MNGARTRLLIVEADPALQKQMCWAFDQYETIVAGDRESAVAMVRRYEPAVVTMDLGLPPHPDSDTWPPSSYESRRQPVDAIDEITVQFEEASAIRLLVIWVSLTGSAARTTKIRARTGSRGGNRVRLRSPYRVIGVTSR